MNWELIDTEIKVENIKMIVYDVCKTCRRIWAKNDEERFIVKVDRYEVFKITKRQLINED